MNSAKDGMLEFGPNNVEVVRKDINLDGPGRMDEAVDLLEEWVKMQNHFLKKNFSRKYLETTLVSSKGMIERAKQKLDKLCTLKTLMPDFYPNVITRELYSPLDGIIYHAHLPKMTKEHYRVYILKILTDDFSSFAVMTYYRNLVLLCEYLKTHDYNKGFYLILDYRNVNNLLSFVSKISPVDLRQVTTLLTEGYGMRLKRFDVISDSKMVDTLVLFLKQVLSTKLGNRIHVHKSLDTLYKIVDKEILPQDYDGNEISLKELNEKWRDALSSKENVDLFNELCEGRTDESCRQSDSFNEHYVGMPGSFRALSVD